MISILSIQVRPTKLKSKIFLDSGNPEETKKIFEMMGFLDGQTTNPTLLSKDPEVISAKQEGRLTRENLLPMYKEVINKIATIIPQGSISIEVFANLETTHEEMLSQAENMYTWIPNAHIKFPTSNEGLIAASQFSSENKRLNMTLCFSQQQAAAVYSATKGAKAGSVYISPFIGRLDDIGINGMSLVRNIMRMYASSDKHVWVLAASVRTLIHMQAALALNCEILTVPFAVLEEWVKIGMPVPDEHFTYNVPDLRDIPYEELDLDKPFTDFSISHELTTKGIQKFDQDIATLLG